MFVRSIDASPFMKTSRKPTRCAEKYDMIIFYWIIIELIYYIVYF